MHTILLALIAVHLSYAMGVSDPVNGISLSSPILKESTPAEHILFRDRSEAIAFFEPQLDSMKAAFMDPTMEIVTSSPDYDYVEPIVNEIWQAYQRLFPEYTSFLNKPPVVLVKAQSANAFVSATTDGKQMAHAIVIFMPVVESAKSLGRFGNDRIGTTIAHELAHSVFRHGLRKYSDAISRYYLRPNKRLGFLSRRDEKLDKKITGWTENAAMAGDLLLDELRGLPVFQKPVNDAMRVWMQIESDIADDSVACQKSRAAFANWSAYMRYSPATNDVTVRPADLPALDAASQDLIEKSRRCFAGKVRAPFFEVLTKATGASKEELQQRPGIKKIAKVFDSTPDIIDAIRTIVQTARATMTDIAEQLDVSAVGHYTHEEHADEVAAIVLKLMGKDPGEIVSKLTLLLAKQPEEKERCEALLEQKALPPSGTLSDPHRSLCYRVGHIRDFDRMMRLSHRSIEDFSRYFIRRSTLTSD